MTAALISLCAARAANEAALDEIDCLCNDVWELMDARDWKRAMTVVDRIRALQLPAASTRCATETRDFCARAFTVEIGIRMSEEQGGAA